MKKICCFFLCITLCFLFSSCSSYRKMDIFSFLNEYEKTEPEITRQGNILIKDDAYYIFYRTESNACFLLTVTTDHLQIPQMIRLFFAAQSDLPPDRIRMLSMHCLQVFANMNDAQSDPIFEQLQANDDASYFRKHTASTETKNHLFKMTSFSLFTTFDFQVRYPSVQRNE